MKHRQIILNSILTLIVVCALAIYVFGQPTAKPVERFVADDPNLAPAQVQGVNNTYCKRELVFPNMNQNDFLASSRSLPSATIADSGNCNIVQTNKQLGDSYSIVHENYMYYSLRRVCILLSFANITYGSGGIVTIHVDCSTPQKAEQLAKFILLNPVFTEFTIASDKTSIAYFPVYQSNFNAIDNLQSFNAKEVSVTPFPIMLVPITNQKFFNYNTQAVRNLDLRTLLGSQKPASLSANVFHLDYLEASAANIRQTLDLTYDASRGVANIFQKNFEGMAGSSQTKQYQFFKNIYMYHKYQAAPIFTFKLTMSVPATIISKSWTRSVGFEANTPANNTKFATQIWQDLTSIEFNSANAICSSLINFVATKQTVTREELSSTCQALIQAYPNQVNPICAGSATIQVPTTVARVYMGSQPQNAIGYYGSACAAQNMNDQGAGDPINNVVQLVVAPLNANYFRLMAITSVADDCNYNPADANNTFVDIPYSSESMSILLTVSPFEKILTVYWNIKNSSTGQVFMSRRRNCSANNNFFKLFMGTERNDSNKLDDMFLKYNTTFVKDLSWVKLGYVNMYSEIYS